MTKLMMITMAFVAFGLSACSSTDSARVDQAPYAEERTVGAQTEMPKHQNTVFHARQSK